MGNNYNKSFNFRNGVQVDNDNFIVNPNGLVGIGTSIPREFLDVYGTAKVTGLVTATNLAITGVSTFYSDVKVGSAITFNSSTGIVSAAAFYGSASGLTDIYAIAVDGWYVNAGNISTTSKVGIATDFPNYSLQVGQDPLTGNGFSVDAITGNVNTTGIITATKFSGPGDDISNLNASVITSGTLDNARLPQNINVSGILTAYSFTGFGTNLQGLNATNITSGTLNNSRLPQDISISGIITANTGDIAFLNNTGIATLGIANASTLLISGVTTSTGGFVGDVIGTATTATSLTGSPNITVANITSSDINNTGTITSSDINNTGNLTSETSIIGISTVSTRLYAESIGVGTDSPSSDIHIRKSSISKLQVTSDTAEAIVAIGRSTNLTGSNGALRFGNTSGLYPYSNQRTLDIVNYDTGNINYYLQLGTPGTTGSYNWFHGQSATNLMTLTYQGNLGLGVTLPTNTIHVSGSSTVSGNSYVGGDFYASNNVTVGSDLNVVGNLNLSQNITANLIGNVTGNLSGDVDSTGISTFTDALIDNIIVNDSIGIGTTSARSGLDVLESGAIFGNVGIGTTSIIDEDTTLYVVGNSEIYGDTFVGINTSQGVVLTSANGTKYRLFVSNAGVVSTVLVP